MMDMPAIVLAGGLGTRLLEVTLDKIPKGLARVSGRPILDYILENLHEAGIRDVCLAVGHKFDQVVSQFGHSYRNMNLTYSIEHVPLGTGGAALAAALLNNWDEALVVNGDTYIEIPMSELWAKQKLGFDGVILATAVENSERYGGLSFEGPKVKTFNEKGEKGSGLVYAGISLLDFSKVAKIAGDSLSFSLETEILQTMATAGRLGFIQSESIFVDIGTPDSFQEAQSLIQND